MDTCLTPKDVAGLADGSLKGASRPRAEAHVRQCDHCKSAVETARKRAAPDETDAKTAGGNGSSHGTSLPAADGPGYEVGAEMHRSRESVVYAAVDRGTGEPVVLKVIEADAFTSTERRLRFEQEVDAVASIQHPGVVRILGRGFTRGRAWLVMERLEAQTLSEWLSASNRSLDEKLDVVTRIGEAVLACHQRGVLLHGLEPSNVLVTAQLQPRLIDFSLGKTLPAWLSAEGEPLPLPGAPPDSLAWASPEQLLGDPGLMDARSDVHALGGLLHLVLTGRAPHPLRGGIDDALHDVLEAPPRPLGAERSDASPALETLALKALAKNPAARHRSVDAFLADLARARTVEQPAPRKRSWLLATVPLAALALAAILLALWGLASGREVQRLREAADMEARRVATVDAEAGRAMAAAASERAAADVLRGQLADQLTEAGRYAEAGALRVEQLGNLAATRPDDAASRTELSLLAGGLLLRGGDLAKADPLLASVVVAWESTATQPPADITLARALAGEAALLLHRSRDAEALLGAACDALSAPGAPPPASRPGIAHPDACALLVTARAELAALDAGPGPDSP